MSHSVHLPTRVEMTGLVENTSRFVLDKWNSAYVDIAFLWCKFHHKMVEN